MVMEDIVVGGFIAAAIGVVLVLTWNFGGSWEQIQLKKLCTRDGFVYVNEVRFDCRPSALKSPQ